MAVGKDTDPLDPESGGQPGKERAGCGKEGALARSGEADAVLQTNLPGIINGCITPPSWLGRAAAGQRRGPGALGTPSVGSEAAAGTRKGTRWV